MCQLLEEHAPLAAKQEADDFRRDTCYLEETDEVLRRYYASLGPLALN